MHSTAAWFGVSLAEAVLSWGSSHNAESAPVHASAGATACAAPCTTCSTALPAPHPHLCTAGAATTTPRAAGTPTTPPPTLRTLHHHTNCSIPLLSHPPPPPPCPQLGQRLQCGEPLAHQILHHLRCVRCTITPSAQRPSSTITLPPLCTQLGQRLQHGEPLAHRFPPLKLYPYKFASLPSFLPALPRREQLGQRLQRGEPLAHQLHHRLSCILHHPPNLPPRPSPPFARSWGSDYNTENRWRTGYTTAYAGAIIVLVANFAYLFNLAAEEMAKEVAEGRGPGQHAGGKNIGALWLRVWVVGDRSGGGGGGGSVVAVVVLAAVPSR